MIFLFAAFFQITDLTFTMLLFNDEYCYDIIINIAFSFLSVTLLRHLSRVLATLVLRDLHDENLFIMTTTGIVQHEDFCLFSVSLVSRPRPLSPSLFSFV